LYIDRRRTYAGVKGFAKIVKIYDGDTFTIVTKLNKDELFYQRLAGLDAPELKPIIKEILPEGSLIWVEFEKKDKYGRLLNSNSKRKNI